MWFFFCVLVLGVVVCQFLDVLDCGEVCVNFFDDVAGIGSVVSVEFDQFDFFGVLDWWVVDLENVLVFEICLGMVYVEFVVQFVFVYIVCMCQVVCDNFFDGCEFYCVIDGFVVQGGWGEEGGVEILF